jgi:hypothetical protein
VVALSRGKEPPFPIEQEAGVGPRARLDAVKGTTLKPNLNVTVVRLRIKKRKERLDLTI